MFNNGVFTKALEYFEHKETQNLRVLFNSAILITFGGATC